MHRIIFKELEFRNFMSYGNTLNRFEFRDGLTWLHGDNGFGKSAIVEAMTFALLGISYRGGKKEELRNTKNLADGAPTVVVLTFDLDSPPAELETYRVTRSITGKQSTIKLVIEKMVDGVWVAQNKRAGFSQQDFEERVLQFNEVLFKNVIAMNTQETLPFFMLPAAKKRELLESIIAMSLDTWKKENHKRLSEATMSFTLAKNDMVQLNGEIDELNKIYTRMQEEKSVNLSQMKADLETCNSTIIEEQGQVEKLAKKRDKIVKGLIGIKAELDTEGTVDARIVEIRTQFSGVSNISQARRAVAEAQYEYDELYGQHSGIIGQLDEIRERIGERTAERNKAVAEKGVAERSISKKETEVEMTTAKRDKFAEQAKTFVVGTPCPTCGHISDESDVERHKNGEENVLFPGKPDMYATTSGTTSAPKWIPMTHKYLKDVYGKMSHIWTWNFVKHRSRIFGGHIFTTVGKECEGYAPDGTLFGAVSGVLVRRTQLHADAARFAAPRCDPLGNGEPFYHPRVAPRAQREHGGDADGYREGYDM